MEILLNGKTKEIVEADLLTLVEELNLSLEGLVVLHNDIIIKKENYENIVIKENDKLEILSFVSGG